MEQLSAQNAKAFYELEQHYLYDIPDYEKPITEITCDMCHRSFDTEEVKKINGDAVCIYCVEDMLKDKELDEEEIEEWQN